MLTPRDVYDELNGISDATVYIEPPENVKMAYPAAVISTVGYRHEYADNRKYYIYRRIQVTVISRSPDHPLVDYLVRRHQCRHSNHVVRDGLHHDYFTLT